METGRIAEASILTGVLILSVIMTMDAVAGEVLYNGIRLPDDWPPKLKELTRERIPPPYLQDPPDVIPIDLGRQLFVDDFLIEETTLRRSFYTLQTYPSNPILKPDRPWEQKGKWREYSGPYAIPFSDGVWYDPKDKLFKMWYMGGLLYCTCYATSKDGIHWEKPSLDVKPGTNIVHPGNRDSSTVWLDLEEKDPSRRYKMFRFQKGPRRGLVLHFSPDGIHWSDEVAWAGKCNDRTTVFYNPFRRVWVYSIKAVGPVRGQKKPDRIRRYWEQSDLLKSPMWKDYEDPLLWANTDRFDPLPVDSTLSHSKIYNLDAVGYESVLLGLFSIVQRGADRAVGRPKTNEIFLGFSRDGFHWDRPFRKPIVGVSDRRGDWNWGNVQSAGGGCLIVGDKLYFYYSGRAGNPQKDGEKNFWDADAATGLGFMRRDGFVSMDAGEDGGTLTTRAVRFSGKYMFVNADADEGELRVEVLDKAGKVIDPFSRENCLPISTDKTLQPVKWKGAENLSAVAGKPVKFRFHLKNGRLYAFWVSPDHSGASYGYVAAGGPGFTGPRDTVGSTAYRQ